MTLAAVLTLYAGFLAVGLLAARKARHGSALDLLVAGRALPLWLAVLTMTATWVDGGYLLGTVEGTFTGGVPLGAQGGLCFGVSLVVGGIVFARRMRQLEFTTLIDPFEVRFGARWAAVLLLPALAGELFWSAELLVAIGSTFGAMLGIAVVWAILLSAAVVTVYTMVGGLWSVAYTDAVQLGLVAVGLLVAVPFALAAVGGFDAAWAAFATAHPGRTAFVPSTGGLGAWSLPAAVNWWDVSLMLVFGGIPWNCYFQRVLSCQSPGRAQWHSVLAGLVTMACTVPPLLIGIAATAHAWPSGVAADLAAHPSQTLPMVLHHLVPSWVAVLGLGAIIGAVTSSFSASILSAGAMCTWNGFHRLRHPRSGGVNLVRAVRIAVLALGAAATLLALGVQSVRALWFFTSDLVFVLLLPQLVAALFDSRANRIGSIAAFAISLVIRLGGGEPLFGVPPLVPYPEWAGALLPGAAADWYDAGTGAMLFPFKTLAAAAGLVVLPVVSRLTARIDPPRRLSRLRADPVPETAGGRDEGAAVC